MANNTDLNERLFNAMLKVAAEEATIQEMDEFPSREELEKLYPRTEAFDKRISKIIGKHERTEKRKQAARIFARVAAAVGIFFTVGFAALMSVEASRNLVLRTIFNIYDGHVVFEFGEPEHIIYDFGDYEWHEEYGDLRFPSDGKHPLQGLLPVGFEYIQSNRRPTSNLFIFENNADKQIIFEQREKSEELRMYVGNENSDFSIWEINSQDVFVFEALINGDFHIIMWEDDRYIFSLLSNIDIDVLVEIVRNMIER
ncbi:MAG: DUF4367 domain-containing protein [Defluviitaleaceae bacterium]|nr:DUF4367 domain-containing protein [Defluviitaleaceae bacterium]